MANLNLERADLRKLEFVRTPTQEEIKNKTIGETWSFWQYGKDGESGWLSPQDVVQYGLSDKMRDGLNAQEIEKRDRELDDTAIPPQEQPANMPPGMTLGDEPLEVLGGHTDKLRWQKVVEADGEILWVIDNKPAIENWDPDILFKEEGKPSPQPPVFEHIVVSDEVIQTIAGRVTPQGVTTHARGRTITMS